MNWFAYGLCLFLFVLYVVAVLWILLFRLRRKMLNTELKEAWHVATRDMNEDLFATLGLSVVANFMWLIEKYFLMGKNIFVKSKRPWTCSEFMNVSLLCCPSSCSLLSQKMQTFFKGIKEPYNSCRQCRYNQTQMYPT